MSECEFCESGICTWNDYYPNDKPCKFLVGGKCIAKDEDLITEEEFEEMLEKETNQGGDVNGR